MNTRFGSLIFMVLFLLSAPALGAPVRVVLFPDSGQITEQISPRQVQNGQVEFFLPGTADPQSLTVRLIEGEGGIENISWSKRKREDPQEVRVLLQELDTLKQTQSTLTAQREGARATATFWKTLAQKGIKDTAQAVQLGSDMGRELEKAMIRGSEIESQLTELNRKLSLLQARIDALRGRLETMWQVRVDLAGNAADRTRLEYSYVLTGCGWHSLYRLNARPDQDLIDFTWTARVHQQTGVPWTKVSLALATARPGASPEPGPVRPWIIAPRREQQLRSKAAFSREMLDVAPAPAMMANAPAPTEKGTYAVWELGTRTIAPGEPVRLSLTEESWPTAFRYLVRPSRSPLGFLQGEVNLKSSRRIPAGTAMFLVDGAMLDKRTFALADRTAEIFFGNDPLIGAEVVLKNRKSGEKGFFAGRQSFAWAWNMTVTNNKQIPIRIRVEEPRPQLRDERITLKLEAVPEPEAEETPALLAWEFDLAPAAEQKIELEVQVAAPKEMKLDTGGRF